MSFYLEDTKRLKNRKIDEKLLRQKAEDFQERRQSIKYYATSFTFTRINLDKNLKTIRNMFQKSKRYSRVKIEKGKAK